MESIVPALSRRAGGRALLLGGATISMLGYVSGMVLAVPRAL